ncbi:MAG TPA: MBL fold metallo-hydrolase [Chloroflexia bacterium]|nr:MBL fold metallo-hydrolase [Chloroflexia bacterium]
MSIPHEHHDHDVILEPPRLQEIADGIFAYMQPDWTWMINNTGFLVGPDGVTVVDTCATEPRTRAFIQSARTVTDKPLRTLINTHHHGDHTYGNSFLPDATIIGHEKCREEAIQTGLSLKVLFPTANYGDIKVRPPFVTFEDRINVYVGDLKLEVFHVGPAHTTNDIVVWVPEKKVLFTGDIVFKNCTPFVMQGAIASYFGALDRLRALGAEVIVPGHGPVCGPEAFDEVEEYLHFVQDTARQGFEAGITPLELARETDLGKFAGLSDPERIVGNFHRAYSELRGEPLGTPLPLLQVVKESESLMGHPLRCYA